MISVDQDPDSVSRLHSAWHHQGGEYINAIHWSTDDAYVAVAYADGSLSVVNVTTGQSRWHQQAHGLDTSVLQWSPEGRFLASAGQRGGVKIWDSSDGTLLQDIDCGGDWVQHLNWAPNGTLACASGKSITLWSANGDLIQRFDPSSSTVTGLQWLADGRLCSSSYGMVNVWSVNQQSAQRFLPWKDSLLGMAVSPDERFIAAACQDNAIHLWFLKTGEDLHIGGYPAKPKSMDWSFDGRYLATASEKMVVIWDCSREGPEGTEPKIIPVHQRPVRALSFSRSSYKLVSASQDGLVFVYDIARNEPVAGMYMAASATTIAWSHNDQMIAVGDDKGGLEVCVLRL